MAFTLFDLLLGTYKELGQMTFSIATGGSTTSVVDDQMTRAIEETEKNDYRGGCVFITYDAAGLGAAPEKEFNRCTAFAAVSGTFTTDAFTQAVAAGDKYGYTSAYYPLLTMEELANSALMELGDVENVDTTITTATDTTEYTLPVALKRRITRVEVETDTDYYAPVNGWDYIPSTAGATALLRLPEETEAGHKVRVYYMGRHPTLTLSSSVISELIDPEYVITATTMKALEWQNSRMQGTDSFLMQKMLSAQQKFTKLQMEHAIPHNTRGSKIFILGDD
jgi:hypothetical protein